MKNPKPSVILVPGPVHLFWTSGVYYLWELSKNYRVVLIVDSAYIDDDMFMKTTELLDIAEILYIPKKSNAYLQQRFYYKEFKVLLKKHLPAFVFQHNAVYVDTIYLFHLCKTLDLDCTRISYQTARMAIDWNEDYKARRSMGTYRAGEISVISRLGRILHTSRTSFERIKGTFINYYLIPFLITGRPFVPFLNLHTGKFKYTGEKFRRKNRERYDLYLSYYSCEKKVITELRGYKDDIMKIKHPLETVGNECHKAIFNDYEEDIISIFPTSCIATHLNMKSGLPEGDVVKRLSEIWIATIKILSQKFPECRFIWKLHPNSENDRMMLEITKLIDKRCINFQVLPLKENAQKWMVKSKLIVTDISTVFWWANMLKNKIVISLDVFGYAAGDEAKYYDGVLYFNKLEELDLFDFECIVSSRESSDEKVPTLTELSLELLSNKLK